VDSFVEIPTLPSDERTSACDAPHAPELWPVHPIELGCLALALLLLRLIEG
jgi:hypothetical protein